MKIEGRQVYAADSEVLWLILHDPLALERLLPGCESFEAITADEFAVTLSLRVGQTVERFSGMLKLVHAAPFRGFDFRAEGKCVGGVVNSHGRIYLEEEGEGITAVGYEADVEVGGRLGSVSPRLLETTARAFVRRCLESLERQVALRTRVYTTSTFMPENATSGSMAGVIHQLALFRRVVTFAAMLLAAVFLWRGFDRRRTQRVTRQAVEILEHSRAAEFLNGKGSSGQGVA